MFNRKFDCNVISFKILTAMPGFWVDCAPFDAILHGFAIASQFNLIVWIAIGIGIFWADFVPGSVWVDCTLISV